MRSEALACRASTAWGDMVAAVGLGDASVLVGRIASRKWLVKLEPQQLRSVSVATGVHPAVIQDMGLDRFRNADRCRCSQDGTVAMAPLLCIAVLPGLPG